MFRVWQRVCQLIKDNTGVEINTEQSRKLFMRMKAEEKQVHDDLYFVYFMLNIPDT